METHYLYEAEKFALSEESIHLLRNRFNYQTLSLSDVDSISIENGKDLKNWLWVLCTGLMLIGFVIYDIGTLIQLLNDDNTYTIYIERLLIPLFPLLLGVYTIVIAMRTSKIMKVNVGNKQYYFSLRKIINTNQYDNFELYMRKSYPSINVF